ncbi:MAG: response regulator, partial [Saprospiraceae bacterium]|nr:response regulator [Saprospiraceae bacterium]
APSQDEAFIDSLENIIQSPASSDSLIAEAYKHIANHLIQETSTDRALDYLRRLERFSLATPYPEGMLKVNFYKAYYHYRRGRHDSVMIYTGKLADVARQLDKPREEALALNRMALTSNVIGKHEEAFRFFKESHKVNEKANDSILQLTNFLGMATLEKSRGNYDLAIKRYLTIDSLYGHHAKRDHYRIGLAHHNIGLIYLEFMKEMEKALSYLTRAKAEYNLMNQKAGEIPSVDVEIARIHISKGNYRLADSLFRNSLGEFRRTGHKKKIGETAMKYSALKIQQEKYLEAEELLEEAESEYVNLNAPFSLSDIYHELGLLKRKLGKNSEAMNYFEKAIGLDLKPYQKQKSIRALAQVQYQKGEFKMAFESLESYLINQDSINEAQLKEALQEAEVRYESSQKQQEILALQYHQAEQRSKNVRSLFVAGGLLIMLAVVTFVFYYRARQRRKTNAKLRELDDLKSKLFANISHEFRTPLSLIKGPLDLILQEEVVAKVREKLEVVRRNSVRLTHLIDSVSELAQLDAGKINLKVHVAKLSDHLKVMAASFESLAQSKGCTFRINIVEDQSDSHYDPQIVETIIYNLLSNAFKYAPEGEVEIKYDRDGDRASISVKDHGPGLSTEDQERVFDRYFRVENREHYSEGIGIGLALSHELAKLHHGELSLVSELNTGSTFTFIFPIGEESYTAQEISQVSPIGSSGQQPIAETLSDGAIKMPPMHEDELVILLVEDNPDMRAHLQQLFSDDYRILLAADGIQGMEMAARFVPDLVISDLMMPNMDGRELLLRLRGDPKTSHIPFIMLTANQLDQEKLESIQAGVDDFMTKPFSIDEIRVKVENLIRLRQRLREKYAGSSVVDAEKIAANDIEQQFWSQVKEVINENLDNVDFSMGDFARAMHMSRMQLHRKLKALTGTSAAAFLRSQRIKAAAQMLKQNNSSVTDVAFDVGFSSPFYFSKCFKEQYGMAPREYAKSAATT